MSAAGRLPLAPRLLHGQNSLGVSRLGSELSQSVAGGSELSQSVVGGLCLCWPGAPQHHQNPAATQLLFKQLAARSKQSHACGGSGEPAVCPRTRCFARACEHLMRQVEYLPHDRDVALGDRVGRPPPALISDNRLRSRARMRTWTLSTSNTVVPRLPLGRQHSPVSAHGVLRRPLMRARSVSLGGRPRAQRPQAPIGLVRHQLQGGLPWCSEHPTGWTLRSASSRRR